MTKRILFINCCPHSEVEETFWLGVQNRLDELGIDFVMLHFDSPETGIRSISTNPVWQHKNHLLNSCESEFHACMNLWERETDSGMFRFYADLVFETLALFRPDLIVTWNGNHPSDVILKQLAERANCPLLFAERTPWPGMISVDFKGVLSKCSFVSAEQKWIGDLSEGEALELFDEYEETIRSSNITWWEQTDLPTEIHRPTDSLPLLLFAGQVDQDAQNFLFSPHFDTNESAFQWFVNHTLGFGFEILGKHHPKSSTPLKHYQRHLQKGQGQWRDDIDLKQAFQKCAAVVATNSSVLCEAIINRKPAFALGSTMISASGAIDELQIRQDAGLFQQWLSEVLESDGKLSPQKTESWRKYSAYLFANHLFVMSGSHRFATHRGSTALANRLSAEVQASSELTWNDVYDLDTLVDWQRGLIGIRGELKFVRETKPPGFYDVLQRRLSSLRSSIKKRLPH